MIATARERCTRKSFKRMLKVTEGKCWDWIRCPIREVTMNTCRERVLGNFTKIFCKSIEKRHQSCKMLRIQSSSHMGKFYMASQFLHFWFSSMRTSYCWSLLWAAGVSTDGPGEMGGTGCSAEMRRSSLVCSGTARIPEHCFGNSGENWSADNLTA